MTKRHTRHRRQRRQRRRTMKGGAFTQQEMQQLQNNGFNEFQIEELGNLGFSFNDVMQHVDSVMNEGDSGFHGNSDDMAEEVMNQLLNADNHLEPIPHDEDDIHDLVMDNSFDSQGTMDLDELNVTQGAMDLNELNASNTSGYTTEADESFGGKRHKRSYRKRHTKKGRKTRKNNKRRLKHKGGMCFGNGVGSNSYDPNFSIYNTNMLKLFPYKA